ncbi:hypothetical protein BDR04DRAFT_1152366 [Suillus decipiens]|nr:hypothetical protein BDR04DRAFT_1152366 [Suillus decipiens]
MVNEILRYVDLIRQRTSKWANQFPERDDIRVGSYGRFNAQTGRFEAEGNVYDPEFQKLLDATDGKLKLSDHPPVFDDEQKDFSVGSLGVRPKEFSLGSDAVEGIDQAKYKEDWHFMQDKRGAMLVMYKPRLQRFPQGKVFEALYQVPELKDKYIVPSVYKCRAYATYLSNKTGEKFSLALLQKGEGDKTQLDWWTDSKVENLQIKTAEDYAFSPLFNCKRKIPLIRPLMRDSPTPDPEDEGFWMECYPPWEPLDDDGEIDPVYDDNQEDDPNVYNPRRDSVYVPYPISDDSDDE